MDAIVHAPFTEVKHIVYQQSVYLSDNPLMETSYDRLLKAASIMKGWNTPSEVARGLTLGGYKVSAQVMTNWKNRGTVSIEGMTEIARVVGCLYEWLKNGTDPMQGTLIPMESNAEPAPRLGQATPVPVVGTAQLGDNGHWAELEHPVGHGDGVVMHAVKDRNAYAVRCRGDSMKPRIRDGEFVIIEPHREPIPGDEVLVRHVDGRVMVKTYLYQREGRIHLMSVNEAYPPAAFALQDIERFHVVTAIVKSVNWIPEGA